MALSFSNTEIAFKSKTIGELKKAEFLFTLMNNSTLVSMGSHLALLALEWKLPIKSIIKNTIFEQFCGGENFDEVAHTSEKLEAYSMQTILDYGLEAKESDIDFEHYKNEVIRAIQYAEQNKNVPVVSVKITGMAAFNLLEKISSKQVLNENEKAANAKILSRMNEICAEAKRAQVAVFIDAEESWIQNAIDDIADEMMRLNNRDKVIVYNTYQLYRHDRYEFLKKSYDKAMNENYFLGAKIVRGAYMEKERKRAEEMNYESPIQKNKQATDLDFNKAIEFCIAHYEKISCVVASHNEESCMLFAELIDKNKLDKKHAHLNFSQLYGMSDQISYNLAHAGYNVAKYVPYGPVHDIMPYLIRRAQENTSVAGQTSRELALIQTELKRRKNQ